MKTMVVESTCSSHFFNIFVKITFGVSFLTLGATDNFGNIHCPSLHNLIFSSNSMHLMHVNITSGNKMYIAETIFPQTNFNYSVHCDLFVTHLSYICRTRRGAQKKKKKIIGGQFSLSHIDDIGWYQVSILIFYFEVPGCKSHFRIRCTVHACTCMLTHRLINDELAV